MILSDGWGLVEGFRVPKYRSDNEGLAFAEWRKHTNVELDTRNADAESDKKNPRGLTLQPTSCFKTLAKRQFA